MNGRGKENDAAYRIMRPFKDPQSVFRRSQSNNQLKQTRFLFICSLILAAAFAFILVTEWLSGSNTTPSIAILLIVSVAVAVTGGSNIASCEELSSKKVGQQRDNSFKPNLLGRSA